MKYSCKNKEKECESEGTLEEIVKHEAFCLKNEILDNLQQKLCPVTICSFTIKDHFETKDLQCSRSDTRNWCQSHARSGTEIDQERIQNIEEEGNEKLFQDFQCIFCKKLPFKALICQNCQAITCQPCTPKSICKSSFCCYNCGIPEPIFIDLPRNLSCFLDSFRIYCKNRDKGCQFSGSFSQLEEHHRICTACISCKIICRK